MASPHPIVNIWGTSPRSSRATCTLRIGFLPLALLFLMFCGDLLYTRSCTLGLVQSRIRGTYSVVHPFYGLDAYHCTRYHLGYHNEYQIVWGLAIGAMAGVFVYTFAELIPTRRPHSLLGRFKAFLLANPVSTWFQLRDGWGLWPDGGHEDEWVRWRIRWDQQRKRTLSDKHRTD